MTDFIVSAPLLFIAILATGSSSALLFARASLDYEGYRIARAHLYENDQSQCRASKSLWPELIYSNVVYDCPATGKVNGTMKLSSNFSLKTQVNLAP
jgi:hypothetical protein